MIERIKPKFKVGDRVLILHPQLGEMTGTVKMINETHLTAELDKPRKKLYPTDREDEMTCFIRRCKKI